MRAFLIFVLLLCLAGCINKNNTIVRYCDEFENVNHPQIAIWMFDSTQIHREVYRAMIDTLAEKSKYTLIFISPRIGVDLYNIRTMHPILKDLVEYAHSKSLKVTVQFWQKEYDVPVDKMERTIQEGEIVLNAQGKGDYSVTAHNIGMFFNCYEANYNILHKSELFRVFIFKKTAEGFYDPATIKEITDKVTVSTTGNSEVKVSINAGAQAKGYTAYILTQHYYNFCSNFSEEAVLNLRNILTQYADIPFNGAGIDEYRNLTIVPYWELANTPNVFRERIYSLPMSALFKEKTGRELEKNLFDMRYAPEGKPEVRIAAINYYMNILRQATLKVEQEIYDRGKELFGENAFIGEHNTFHNGLETGEVWTTGFNWWNIKRDYGQTDEETPLPTKIGVGMSYPVNAMYNMYYQKSLDSLLNKAILDVRYGIRTHYHGLNDYYGWGYSIEKPEALSQILKIENAVRLMNRFNPSFPKISLLVIFGAEAQVNWYPDESKRGKYDINTLGIEDKAVQLWNAGYLNALVPSDLIIDGRLRLNENGKPTMNGHVFDAVVFLYPQYSRKETLDFLKEYVAKGGKLMVEGTASYDFDANNIAEEWDAIAQKAVSTSFNIHDVEKLGVSRNTIVDGVQNGDGSYTFTNKSFLKNDSPSIFSFTQGNSTFTGDYKGIAVIKVNDKGDLEKLAVSGFTYLKSNGGELLHLSGPADIFLEKKNGTYRIMIADKNKTIHPLTNNLTGN